MILKSSGTTRAVAIDISKTFVTVLHIIYFTIFKSYIYIFKYYGILSQAFVVICFFLSNRLHLVVLDGNSLQDYRLNAGVSQGSFISPTLYLL